ncbi:hypothetical protein [Streptomyces sp. NPDC127108]|uniref:hypothetical protein n=1 Tax=Streptomyces sp. NPDC127108 TaxID=3345361 RepID=UPI003640191B
MQIGSISGGAQAIGNHVTAASTNYTVSVERQHEQVLVALRQLREELRIGEVRTAQQAELDTQLAAVEGEIVRTGRSSAAALNRLRFLLEYHRPNDATAAAATRVLMAIAQVPS